MSQFQSGGRALLEASDALAVTPSVRALAGAPSAFTPCGFTWCPSIALAPVEYERVSVRYSAHAWSGRSRQFEGNGMGSAQRSGLSWDDAALMCAARGERLAVVKTAAEQAAVVAAVAALVAEQIANEDDGAEFTSAWLGARRSTALPYWHWMDGSEVWLQNYTNWVQGFKVRDFHFL